MFVDEPFEIYREQLSSLCHGYALWSPDPEGLHDRVSISDVGDVGEGALIRTFNVTPSGTTSRTDYFVVNHRATILYFPVIFVVKSFNKVDYYSRRVSRKENANNTQAASPDE